MTDEKIDEMLDKVLTVQYNLVTTNDLKSSLRREIKLAIAQELRKVPQVDTGLETYLWGRIDELEERP